MSQDSEHFKILEIGELVNIPSATSAKEDFDFYVGHWNIRNRRLKKRLENCQEWIEFEASQEMNLVLNGLGNLDYFHATFDGKPFEGMSIRYFDQRRKLWSIF